MKHTSSKGFTLIEILIVIMIIGIISFATYLPYAHHQKKTLLNQSTQELSQLLTSTRNSAIHGVVAADKKNRHTYIELSSGDTDIIISSLESDLDIISDMSARVEERKITLPTGVVVHSINGSTSDLVLGYEAITGTLKTSVVLPSDTLKIILSYKNTNSPSLQRDIIHYTSSHISDY